MTIDNQYKLCAYASGDATTLGLVRAHHSRVISHSDSLRVSRRVLQSLGMTKVPQALLLGSSVLFGLCGARLASAQSAPTGAHPRIWLDAATRSGIQAQAGVAGGAVARAQARCAAAQEDPDDYAEGGWQGFEFVTTLSGCLTSYVASGDAGALATAIKYWKALLDDYQDVGDGLGGDSVVTHDTGYAMRTFAPFSALAYDWLHDAPGVTEELRAHARARFGAWFDYYSSKGYLRDLPGANYHAGYVFAASLIAIAEGGEAGAAGDAHWSTLRDVIWQKDLLPAFASGQVLDGGDWPEGWQYGSLSVLELSLSARALRDSGLSVDVASGWASSLPLRFVHGLTPGTRQAFTGGDSDAPGPYRAPDNGPLLAALAGPASPQAKQLARKLNGELGLRHENPLFDALAAADTATAEPPAMESTTSYLARGTGNWYVRGAWTPETAWGVFQCTRRLVDDHQYANAGNWVLSRGADDVIVDPSPYGSLSTLTGNAPAIDSKVLPDGYSPSQGYWGEQTRLVFSRQSASGVAVARCDYADQFRRSDVPSDVSQALRDFVMVPKGDGAVVVLIDRAVTGASDRALHFRVRTPAALSLAGDTASGKVGSSNLAIRKLWASSGTANVRSLSQASECPSSSHVCDVSKLPTSSEYRIDVAGPSALALHVISAQASADARSELLSGNGYRGALITQQGAKVAVIAADPASSLVYRAPAEAGSVHVVLDAPVDAQGQSDVSATRDGADCQVEVKAHSGTSPGIDGRPLVVRVGADCVLEDDGAQKAASLGSATPSASGPGVPTPGVGGAMSAAGGAAPASVQASPAADSAGCSLSLGARAPGSAAALALSGLGLLGALRRRRQAA